MDAWSAVITDHTNHNAWHQGRDLYGDMQNRLGIAMLTTERYTDARRPMGANYFLAWETLTHANNP